MAQLCSKLFCQFSEGLKQVWVDCNLKKLGQFFKFFTCVSGSWDNRIKLTIFCSPFEKVTRYLRLGVLGAIHVDEIKRFLVLFQ